MPVVRDRNDPDRPLAGPAVAYASVAQPFAAVQQPQREREHGNGESHQQAERERDADITDAEHPVAEGVDHVKNRVEVRNGAGKFRQRFYGIEHTSQIDQRGENERGHDGDVVKVAGEHGIDEATQRAHGRGADRHVQQAVAADIPGREVVTGDGIALGTATGRERGIDRRYACKRLRQIGGSQQEFQVSGISRYIDAK